MRSIVCHHSFLFIAHHCQRQPCERDEQLTADALDFFGDSEDKDERRIQSMASLGKRKHGLSAAGACRFVLSISLVRQTTWEELPGHTGVLSMLVSWWGMSKL